MVAYADKTKQHQHQEEGEEDIDRSRFGPGPERRGKLQQGCRKVHFWCWRWPEAKDGGEEWDQSDAVHVREWRGEKRKNDTRKRKINAK